jgi:hypothetical protein
MKEPLLWTALRQFCLDDKVSPTPGSCIVISFGMANERSFEEAMEEYGCKVRIVLEEAYLCDPAKLRSHDDSSIKRIL